MSIGLSRSQRFLAAALLDPAAVVPPFLRAASPQRVESAFGIYRNNVVSSLINVLRVRFPVVGRLIGEESFAALALRFVTLHPPRSPLLLSYGDGLPQFLHCLSPAPSVRYLADVARLEVARGQAYHAADARPVAADRLRALSAPQLPSLRVALHPSVVLLSSKYPLVSAWEVNQPGADGRLRDWRNEDALVVRPSYEVTVTRLPNGGFAFLSSLASGETLAQAIEAALADDAGFDLVVNFAVLAGSGIVVDLQ